MKTKFEILLDNDCSANIGLDAISNQKLANAMDQYAKEQAIEFTKHLCQIDAVLYSKDRLWIPDKDNSTNGWHTTIEEYYNDYYTPIDK